MIRFETVSLGSGGVSPCVRCNGRSSEPSGADTVLSALTAAAVSRPDGILFTGHEPFAHPSLVELISGARGLGVPRIGVQTDGAALGVGQNAPGSIGAGVRFFEFVFLGEDELSHDRLAGRDGAFASLMAGVAAVKRVSTPDQRVYVAGVVRVCRHNVAHFVGAVAAAVAAGVRSVRVELDPGVDLLADSVNRAHVVATTAGVALFGDGCGHLLRGARLYSLGSPDSPAPTQPSADGEVARG